MARAVAVAAFCAVGAAALRTSAALAGYVRRERADSSSRLDITFAVRIADSTSKLEALLYEVSDPASRSYGRHVSKEVVDDLLAASPASSAAIMNWLFSNGIVGDSTSSGFIRANGITIEQAEALLSTRYYRYEHPTAGSVHRCEAYSLPAGVAEHIEVVAPTTQFPAPRTLASAARVGAAAAGTGVTPDVIRTIYGVGNASATNAASRQVAAGFLEQYMSTADLVAFYQQFDASTPAPALHIIGPNDQTNPGLEASLDVQYISAVGRGVDSTFWYTDGTRPNDNEPFLAWLLNVSALSNALLPRTISVSYGDNENTVDIAYAKRVTQQLQALGARGVTFLFSSGDGGVAGSQPTSCNSGFIPTFPAASPYVTAVGATDNPANETAAGFSSGGFSNFWARPSYQAAAVATYFTVANASLPPARMYNASGAGFPDVAAIGTNFNIVCSGTPTQVAGTSCSAPSFAGMVALLNDARFAVGKSSLGWLNPLLYSAQGAPMFRDITAGNNPGCGTKGFYAAPGWDPVTGLGVLDFQAALKVVLALP